MSDKTEQYLNYLDKEMSIMGILSTFCVAVPSLVLERLASAKDNDLASIWSTGKDYFWIASALMLLSAALFYKQRSLLAFYYGRIALGKPPPSFPTPPQLKDWDWKDWADSWTTWIPYHIAFWIAMSGAFEYLLGFSLLLRVHVGHYAMIVFSAIITVTVFVHKDRPLLLRCNVWVERIREVTRVAKRV